MNPEERYQASKKVTLVTLFINLLLSIAKIIIGIIFFSQAIVADGIHSVSDVISTLAVWVAIRISREPADKNHPYGHGRAEAIAAKFIGLILLLTGLVLIKDSIMTIVNRNFQEPGSFNIGIAVVSIIAKEWMYHYTFAEGERLNNKAMEADAYHHRSDALSSIAALLGVLGAKAGYLVLDPIAGVVVACFILKMGFDIFKDSIDTLMDKADQKLYSEIQELISSDAEIIRIEDLKVSNHGPDIFINLRLVVDDDLSIVAGHQIAERIEDKIKAAKPAVQEVLIHIDPVSVIH